ncbi:hypothetical protein BH23BAC4_BH23BAC4_08450 [soil metagenome]
MMVPVIIPAQYGIAAKAPHFVVEVEPEIFAGLLPKNEKPLVFEQHAGFPKTYRYFVQLGDYVLMCLSRERQQMASLARVLPVKAFHAGPAGVM